MSLSREDLRALVVATLAGPALVDHLTATTEPGLAERARTLAEARRLAAELLPPAVEAAAFGPRLVSEERPAEHCRNALQLLGDLRDALADLAPDVPYTENLLGLVRAAEARLHQAVAQLEHS